LFTVRQSKPVVAAVFHRQLPRCASAKLWLLKPALTLGIYLQNLQNCGSRSRKTNKLPSHTLRFMPWSGSAAHKTI
jgi:hypothetical protein